MIFILQGVNYQILNTHDKNVDNEDLMFFVVCSKIPLRPSDR